MDEAIQDAHQRALYQAVTAGDFQAAAHEVKFWTQQGAPTPFGSCDNIVYRSRIDTRNTVELLWLCYPLHHAISRGLTAIAKMMVDEGANFNGKIYEDFEEFNDQSMVIKQMSQTPLMLACQALDVEMVELLIQRGADVQATDQKGYSVLHYAVWSQQEPWQQQLTLLKYLRKHGPDSHGNGNAGWTSMRDAVRKSMTECLLIHGADVNAKTKCGTTPLELAIGDDVEIAQLLIQYEPKELADPKETSYLADRATSESIEFVKLLKDYVDIDWCNREGCPILENACRDAQFEIVELLLSWGLDPDTRDRDSDTPLYTACEFGRVDVVELLLSSGADPNTQARMNSETPLHLAAREGETEILLLLLTSNADPHARDEARMTPLHWATGDLQVDAAELLLMHGADPNAQDEMGRTPLHVACPEGSAMTVDVLLQAGADVSVKDVDGNTALNLCLIDRYQRWHYDVDIRACVQAMLTRASDVILLDKAVSGACALLLQSMQIKSWQATRDVLRLCFNPGHMEGLALYKADGGHSALSPPSDTCYDMNGASFRQEFSDTLNVHRMWMLNHAWSHEDCYRVEYSGEQAEAPDATAVVAILCIHACLEDNDALVHSATQGSIIKWHYQIYRRQLMNQLKSI